MLILIVIVRIFFGKFLQFRFEAIFFLHSGQNRFTVEFIPFRRHVVRIRIHLFQHFQAGMQFFFGNSRRMRQHHAGSVRHLIDKKFAEVFHIHLALVRVHHGAKSVQHAVFHVRAFHCADYIAQFSHAGRLDDNTIGLIFRFHFFQGLGKIAHKRTTDTSRIHLGDIHARVFQKAAVHADFAEFVFDQHYFFACIRLFDQFFDQRSFSRAQKSRKYVYLRHNFFSFA